MSFEDNQTSKIFIKYDSLSTFSLAAQQNSYPVFRSLAIVYEESELEGVSDEELEQVVVSVQSNPKILDVDDWVINGIKPGETIELQQRALNIEHDFLVNLTEEIKVNITIEARSKSDSHIVFDKKELSIAVLPSDFWGGEVRQPDLLAAFVKPNGVYIDLLLKKVTSVLQKNGLGNSVDGYQSNTREKPYAMVAALWNVLRSQKISYVSPPLDFARMGQRIRLASDINQSKIAACLDTSVLFASCLEAMGLNPIIALTQTHAFVGVWLINSHFSLLTNDDAMDLRKRVDAKDIIFFETTLITNETPVTFEYAKDYARDLINEEHESEFVYVIDIKQARSRKIRPIYTVEEKLDKKEIEVFENDSIINLPYLPPVRSHQKVLVETPETRVDAWQRKLLDLTKRNTLLSLKSRSVSIDIYCPDIGFLEDGLANGDTFHFVSSEESPLNDVDRSDKFFRLQSSSNIHKEYALNQLKGKAILVNMPKYKLYRNAINLLRKARNDLEEGGSNTLFLALGMLSWKETPADENSYKAPLILLPIELIRQSASSPIKVRLLNEEPPIFNLTLIEFLESEYNIDINSLREELPQDDSGVDVKAIWNVVRQAIKEHAGFEVVEDTVIACFSFAKYLMWKDLKERTQDLKKSAFVKHLIDHPREAYQQQTSFVDVNDVDNAIDPHQVCAPLNCDSSQLVAVEASGRDQDFVLEGPPGTGKSETIANIICHNLSRGRKVLFVAEKIAALNVVYRRMEKIGLDHLCLELHSKKANKKAVLQQLKNALDANSSFDQDERKELVKSLVSKRETLNQYVKDINDKTFFGISAHQAIGRSVRFKNEHLFNLNWEYDFEAAPINNPEQLKEMLIAVNAIMLAYNDVELLDHQNFNCIKQRDWSNVWQSNAVGNLKKYKSVLNEYVSDAKEIASSFNVDFKNSSLKDISSIKGIATLLDLTSSNSMSYIFSKGVKSTLDDLHKLSLLKESLDTKLSNIGHNSSAEIILRAPVNNWVAQYENSKGSFFKKFITKFKINREAKKLGFKKFKKLDLVVDIEEANTCIFNIQTLSSPFEQDEIWQGWNTKSKFLASQHQKGQKAFEALSGILGASKNPVDVISALKSQLIDMRDFIQDTDLPKLKKKLDYSWGQLAQATKELNETSVSFDSEISIEKINDAIENIILQDAKLKDWSQWLVAKQLANRYQFENLTESLEKKTITSKNLVDKVETAFSRWLAPQLIDRKDSLRKFKVSSHEQLIDEFRKIDSELSEVTIKYISMLASQNKPDPYAENSAKELGLLAREIQKKSRHKPLRYLFKELRNHLLNLSPCMMMSPMSVAQFLPSDFNEFDLVVFDEASQMTTWDSVGAIARGKNVIVVGDPKQMPPTNFFSRATVDDVDEEDLESILDQALAARLPHLRLKGHYRSRHESLIAFSNEKYYENSLVTFPSPQTKKSAVSVRKVNGIYDKGKARNNLIEAKAVVDEIVTRLTNDQTSMQTIGVVALNTEQQRMIEDLLDDARIEHPEIEIFFNSTDDYDGVFVKNLESVQGDERDVIILSLAYGPTKVGARAMSMNFGPLNRSGGERRLNVAITRAKSEVVLFSSFDSSMIDLNRTSALAVAHLKKYLEFAEHGPQVLKGITQNEERSSISDSVHALADALRDKGWKVQIDVGVSHSKVNIGIVHPDFPGKYLAGIESDGENYFGSSSARDRDRIRYMVLNNLGWKLIRFWSTDFYQNPDGLVSKIDALLKQAVLVEQKGH